MDLPGIPLRRPAGRRGIGSIGEKIGGGSIVIRMCHGCEFIHVGFEVQQFHGGSTDSSRFSIKIMLVLCKKLTFSGREVRFGFELSRRLVV